MNDKKAVRAGAAEIAIPIRTPTMLAGHINRLHPASEFLDHPQIHSLYLDDDGRIVILISLDILELDSKESDNIRRLIAETYHTSSASIMLSCTHTHTAPPALDLGLLERDAEFIQVLSRDILSCVENAYLKATPCIIKSGKTAVRAAINRRLVVGTEVLMMPNPAGLRDEELIGIWFIDTEGNPIASIINYSMHATTLDVGICVISGDYPQYLRQTIRQSYPHCVVLFFNGACGDVRPNLIHVDGGFRGGDFDDVKQIGANLGAGALHTFSIAEVFSDIRCVCIEKRIKLTYDYTRVGIQSKEHSTDSRIARQINPELMRHMSLHWEDAMRKLSRSEGFPDAAEFSISVCALGSEIAVVFLSGEIFVETGLEIKESSPFRITLITGYTNGTVGYIPTASALAIGGSEVDEAFKVYGNPAPFTAASAGIIVQESALLLKRISDELSRDREDCS